MLLHYDSLHQCWEIIEFLGTALGLFGVEGLGDLGADEAPAVLAL
jgi:hypothetical protein